MRRLRPEALYGNDSVELHRSYDLHHLDNPASLLIPDPWARAAENIRRVDPNGERASTLLEQMRLGEI